MDFLGIRQQHDTVPLQNDDKSTPQKKKNKKKIDKIKKIKRDTLFLTTASTFTSPSPACKKKKKEEKKGRFISQSTRLLTIDPGSSQVESGKWRKRIFHRLSRRVEERKCVDLSNATAEAKEETVPQRGEGFRETLKLLIYSKQILLQTIAVDNDGCQF